MKLKKALLCLLCAAMTVSALTLCVSAEGPELGDGYIRFDFSEITGGIVNNVPSAKFEKNVEFEGKKAVRFTPTPDTASGSVLTLDCYSLAKFSDKVEFPRYKYVGIEYYYDSDNPTFSGKPVFKLLPGSTKVVASTEIEAYSKIKTGTWDTMYFSLAAVPALETETPYFNQVHFRPFGATSPQELTANDVLYVSSYTFYEENPVKDMKSTALFKKGNPDAKGTDPEVEFTDGSKVKLPENPFEYANGEFLGWKYSLDSKLYQPGDELVLNGNVTFDAQWNKLAGAVDDFISLDFTEYENGVVNHVVTAYVEHMDVDGRNVVRVVPDPSRTDQGKRVTIDGWSYKGAGVDLGFYNWFAVEYKYDSPDPVDTPMSLAIMTNGNVITKSIEATSTENLVSGTWAIALFDFSGLSEILNPESGDHIMRQLHVRPYHNTPLDTLSTDDVMYISRVMFFQERPNFETHDSYMKGYNDGRFQPDATMSRAEACTVIARLLEAEENIAGACDFTDVAADAWYAKYIGFCREKGLLASYPAGNFNPDTPITRAEFAELTYLTGLAKAGTETVTFTDVDASHPKYASIMAAASAKLIKGYPDGSFKPDATISRAEVVTVVNRARGRSMTADKLADGINVLFLDVDFTHWAYADIAEASVPHVEWNGSWVYASKDPAKALAEKVDITVLFDTATGNAKVAELDALEAARIAEIRSTASELSAVKGKKVYVSAAGDDANDGLSETSPVKTVKKANSLAASGDAVLLKRGDLFREKFTAKAGVTYSAYGTGDKPKVYGSPENGADPEKWILVLSDAASGKKIWEYYRTDLTDVGTIVFNEGEGYAVKEYPTCKNEAFIVRGTVDTPFEWETELDNNFEFFHEANSKMNGNVIDAATAKGPLYLRCDNGNPGEVFDSIEFNEHGHIISVGTNNNVTIDNLCLMYTGSHGISAGTVSNLVVTNCEIGWIGGTVQGYYADANKNGVVTRFGNGVEIYGGCDNYVIDNCYIYQCYDAGVTHQAGAASPAKTMNNIRYSKNVITDCVYSIEYFFGDASEGMRQTGKNIVYEDNLLRRAGFGFGSSRPNGYSQRHIRTASTSANAFTDFVIRNNIFDRSVYDLLFISSGFEACLPRMEGNTYIQGIGNPLFSYGVAAGKPVSCDVSSKASVNTKLGDATAQVYFVNEFPYWSYDFEAKTIPGTYIVNPDDMKKIVDLSELEALEEANAIPAGETDEIFDPIILKTAKLEKGGKFYSSGRASMNITDEMVDEKTGIVYSHVEVADASNYILYDCYGIKPEIPVEKTVYVKLLLRTNYAAKPNITLLSLKDDFDESMPGNIVADSSVKLKANGEWEEIIIPVYNNIDDCKAASQMYINFWGSGATGTNTYAAKSDAWADVAGYAVFPNKASAQAFDFTESVRSDKSSVTGAIIDKGAAAAAAESVSAPLLVKTAKDSAKGKFYSSARASMTVTDSVTDEATGIVHSHFDITPETNAVIFDCAGLPRFDLGSTLYAKVLIRSNYPTPVGITVYSIQDANGEKVSAGLNANSTYSVNDKGEWEEVLIAVPVTDSSMATGAQIYVWPFGQNAKGSDVSAKKGDAWADVAGFALFENKASAKAYNLTGDCK